MKLCFQTEVAGYPVTLHQSGRDAFRVTYGLQIRDGLTYGQAANELGMCLLHGLACEGKVKGKVKG